MGTRTGYPSGDLRRRRVASLAGLLSPTSALYERRRCQEVTSEDLLVLFGSVEPIIELDLRDILFRPVAWRTPP
jgi:hypothetical protein